MSSTRSRGPTRLSIPAAWQTVARYRRRVCCRAIRRAVDFETTHVDVCSALPLFKEFAAECPGAKITEQAIQLPVYSRLRKSDVERVLRVVREVTGDLAPLGRIGKLPFAVTSQPTRGKSVGVN